MNLKSEFRIAQRRQTVWAALADESILADTLPGLKSIETTADNERTVKVMAKVGTLRPTITAKVSVSDWRPPEAMRLAVAGRSPSAGTIDGTIDLSLREEGAETVVAVHCAAKLTGKLADLDAASVKDAAAKIAADYFADLAERDIGSNDFVHTPAAIDIHDEPDRERIEDKAEEAAEFAEATEERIELAAAGGFLGGPVVWGLLALLAVVVILFVLR